MIFKSLIKCSGHMVYFMNLKITFCLSDTNCHLETAPQVSRLTYSCKCATVVEDLTAI